MAGSRELNLKVFFEAVDRMSGPLQKIGLGLENADKMAKGAARSIRHFAAVAAIGAGAWEAARKGSEHLKKWTEAADPLREAQTAFEQVSGSARAANQALLASERIVSRYGGSWADTMGAMTQAYRLFGSTQKAIAATTVAAKLAVATHQPLAQSFADVSTFARGAGISIAAAGDQLAAFFKIAGTSAESKSDVVQLSRALAAARLKGIDEKKFLAMYASLVKSGGDTTGVPAELVTMLEPARGGRGKTRKGVVETVHERATAKIIESEIAKAGDLGKNLAALKHTSGSLDSQLRLAQSDAAQQLAVLKANERLRGEMKGMSLFQQGDALLGLTEDASRLLTRLETVHPALVKFAVDATAIGTGVGYIVAPTIGAVLAFRHLRNALDSASLSATKLGAAVGAGKEAGAAGAAEKEAGVMRKLAGAAGYAGLLIGAKEASDYLFGHAMGGNAALRDAMRKAHTGTWYSHHPWLADIARVEHSVGLAPAPPAVHVHVEHRVGDIHVTVPEGTTSHDAVETVKTALSARDSELEDKLHRALARHAAMSVRTNF